MAGDTSTATVMLRVQQEEEEEEVDIGSSEEDQEVTSEETLTVTSTLLTDTTTVEDEAEAGVHHKHKSHKCHGQVDGDSHGPVPLWEEGDSERVSQDFFRHNQPNQVEGEGCSGQEVDDETLDGSLGSWTG